ncbi:MAG: YtxH domain-containing protein [Bryobacterales bacterium]|nr:YtxH domain-containing protein [Bryobacteraceae bacterium]MDW8131799.1 YtxH domain-containing protein [Bryobacterales bacterium]
MPEESKFSAFIFGFGIGLAVGVLFAPKSGRETREYIRTKAGEGREYLKKRGEELKESAEELIERGKEAVSRQRETLAAALEAGRQAYRDALAGRPSEKEAAAESQS